MIKQRIQSVEFIRGIAMLGVIGIHTGAYTLTNPHVNVHLFALLEIVSRFSVPIFFFISAFGLFRSQSLEKKLDYLSFMRKRTKTVFLPYLAWSLLYMLHYTLLYGDASIWHRPLIYKYFLFGLASYQLYFLVILFWFYTLMPLWRKLVMRMLTHPVVSLTVLLVVQIIFNDYSSYHLRPTFSNHYVNILVQHRLDYWVVHYLFIFLLGAICAVKFEQVKRFVIKYYRALQAIFAITLGGMLFFYYHLLYSNHFTPEAAVNTIHQLSPMGVLYTAATTMFLLAFLSHELPLWVKPVISQLSKHSYVIYLVHPFIMFYLNTFRIAQNQLMTGLNTILFYTATVVCSLLIAIAIHSISNHIPMIGLLLAGKSSISKPKMRTEK